VIDIDNTEEFYDNTTLYLPGYWRYPATVDMLKAYIDVAEIRVDDTWDIWSGEVKLILGQDYLNRL
jgi:hypothetical protein